jgi:hypothetical protein
MSKTKKDMYRVKSYHEEKKFNDSNYNYHREYTNHKKEKRLKNALRSKNIKDLMYID